MADDIEKLILSISADTAQVKRSLDRLQKDVDSSTKGIEKGFTSAGAQMGTAFDASAAKINRSFTVIEGGARRAGTTVTQSVGAIRASTQNLSFQLNDIATQLASGTSPFQVMAQQGGQVVQSLTGAGGVLGALRIVGAAALNPFTLATVAITTLAGVATAYFRDSSKSVEEANKKMEEHRAAIKAAIDAWDGAPPPDLVAYNDELERLDTQTKKLAGLQAVIDKGLEPIKQAAAEATAGFEELYARLQARNVDATVLSALKRDFDAMKEAIDGGNASALDLLPLFTRLQDLEAQIGTTKGFDALKKAIQDLAPLIDRVNMKLDDTRKAAAAVASGLDPNIYGGGPNRGFIPTINLPDSAPTPGFLGVDDVYPGALRTTATKDFLKTRAVSDKIVSRIDDIDDSFADGLAKVLAQFPELQVVSAKRTTEEQTAIYNSGVRPAARPGYSLHEKGMAVDLGLVGGGEPSRELLARLYAAAREAGVEFPVAGDPFHAQPIGARGAASSTSTKRSPTDIFQGSMEDIERRINLINAEAEAQANLNPKVNDYGFAIEKAKIEQQLLNEAEKAGVEVTPELAAKIDTLAGNYAKASAGAKKFEADQQAAARASEQLGQIAQTALSGIASALADGKIEAQELLQIAIQVVQQLLQAKSAAGGIGFGGGGGGFLGGIGGIVGSLFGFEKGGIAKNGRPVPLKRFAGGGVSRSAAIFGEAGPEAAVPLPDGRSIPVSFSNMPKMPRAASGPQRIELIVRAEEGEMFRPTVQAEARGVAVNVTQAGINRYDKNMPGRVNEVMERQGRG
jgi:hypothetical protein